MQTTITLGCGRWIDETALRCPGCAESVRAQQTADGPEFVHRDGSELCAGRDGRACDPIEATR